MSRPRVNLLKKSEQRYQGAVSRQFMLVSLIAIPVLLTSVFCGIKLIQYGAVRADLSASRIIWGSLEPRLAASVKQQRGFKANRSALELINGWQASKVSMEGVLTDIQSVIPTQVQLSRLSIRSVEKTSLYQSADEMKLNYEFSLQGISVGDKAEAAVINLRRNLLNGEDFPALFDSVNLTSMRKRRGLDGDNMREFSLEGRSTAKEGGEE